MSRNAFESNAGVLTPEEARLYGDKLVAFLPSLKDGEHYEIVNLAAGTGIVRHERTTQG